MHSENGAHFLSITPLFPPFVRFEESLSPFRSIIKVPLTSIYALL